MTLEGPSCGGCGKTEAWCAFNFCTCCPYCSHTFDGGGEDEPNIVTLQCARCSDEFSYERTQGPLRKYCDECVSRDSYLRAAKAHAQGDEQPTPNDMARVLIQDTEDYQWRVAHTGTAHLVVVSGRMAHCGKARIDDPTPSPDWFVKCVACSKAWRWEILVTVSA